MSPFIVWYLRHHPNVRLEWIPFLKGLIIAGIICIFIWFIFDWSSRKYIKKV
jgi:hypothetical protein